MALSPDDRLLGEKVHYYCSSSEDEGDEEGEDEGGAGSTQPAATFIPEPQIEDYKGYSVNTGPKGVINDWRRFKQLETERKDEQEREKKDLIQKLSMTCRSHLDDEKEKAKDEAFLQQLEDLDEFEDEFMREYRQKRIEEMRRNIENIPRFGGLCTISKQEFVETIDKEKPTVTIIIHLFEDGVSACEAMNGCLSCLASEYPTVKFCKLKASEAKLSFKFSSSGVPALLIYKGGELIGNFIRLSDEFGEDFYATQVESFLLEHGFLPDKRMAAGIRGSELDQPGDSDSDLD